MAIEEEFGIDVPDEDTQGLKTVQDVVDYIKSKQG
jgi:acyl carrier protein